MRDLWSKRRWGHWVIVSSAGIALAALIAVALVVGAGARTSRTTATAQSGCPRLLLYFSRGSSESVDGPERGLASTGYPLYQALLATYHANVGVVANGYSAVSVPSAANPFSRPSYASSVANGVQSADRNIADVLGLCPQSYLILAGYSQGAQVTRDVLARLTQTDIQHVAAVLLFGDPDFRFPETNVRFPQAADSPQRFNPRRRGVLIQRPFSKATPIPEIFAGRVFSWCHNRDLVCQGFRLLGTGFKEHRNYALDVDGALGVLGNRLVTLPGGVIPLSALSKAHQYAVTGTCSVGSCALAEWSGPGIAGSEAVGAAYEGQTVAIVCQVTGQSVSGPNGVTSAIWDRLSNGAFVSDFYINTPRVGAYSPHIPQCRDLAPAKQ